MTLRVLTLLTLSCAVITSTVSGGCIAVIINLYLSSLSDVRNRSYGDAENDGHENAGRENDEPCK